MDFNAVDVYNFLDVPDRETFMACKLDVLQRFVHVVVPLSKVYNLPMSALHIFCDTAGGLIAFNRNGSLFLNLRYFEAWRESLTLSTYFQSADFPPKMTKTLRKATLGKPGYHGKCFLQLFYIAT